MLPWGPDAAAAASPGATTAAASGQSARGARRWLPAQTARGQQTGAQSGEFGEVADVEAGEGVQRANGGARGRWTGTGGRGEF